MEKIILIVDDNDDNSTLANKVLSHYGFSVLIASTGQQALDICNAIKPNLILLDISLPDFTGYEVAIKMREIEELQEVKIIAFSAHSSENVEKQCHDSGMNGFLQKPIRPLLFIETIKGYF